MSHSPGAGEGNVTSENRYSSSRGKIQGRLTEKEKGAKLQSWAEKSIGFHTFLLPLARFTVHCFILTPGKFQRCLPLIQQRSGARRALLPGSSSKGPSAPHFSRLKMADTQKDPCEIIPYQRTLSSVSVFNWHGSSSPKRSSKISREER